MKIYRNKFLRLYVFEYDVEVYLIQLLHNHILHIYVVFQVYVFKRTREINVINHHV